MQTSKITRVILSYYVTSGLSAALGFFLIAGAMRWWFGAFAGAAASIGVIVVIPPDQPGPVRGKFWRMFPAVLMGVPLFYAVRLAHTDALRLGLVPVPATFFAFLAAAWGRRGIPLSMSAMFSVVFAMAVPSGADVAAGYSTLYFGCGALAYVMYATVANVALNARYREQWLADTLLTLASLMRVQAKLFAGAPARPSSGTAGDGALDNGALGKTPVSPIGELLRGQAALADELQSARDLLLESPRTPRRQRLAGLLLIALEVRDQLLACELDVDLVAAEPDQAPLLALMQKNLTGYAARVEALADGLLLRRAPPRVAEAARAVGKHQPLAGGTAGMLTLGLMMRLRNMDDEISRFAALARGDAEPRLDVVRASWRMFVSPTTWSWVPLRGVWHWDAPPLRHALRAALAIATAYAISLAVPWGTHAYWILLTLVVVLRGSLAQTLERRNSRVAGTLLGSVLAGILLSVQAPAVVILLIVTLAQGVAHAFAVKRYLVTAVAATVLALLQAHLLNGGTNTAFQAFERIADTLIGVAVAWVFSYVLPAWERNQVPALIARTRAAQAAHARLCLEVGQLTAGDAPPELEWRLARREAFDSLSALVQAIQRSLSEPRAVRPPLAPLEKLLAYSYQLMAQLTAIKSTLALRRGHLDAARLAAPLQAAADRLGEIFQRRAPDVAASASLRAAGDAAALPDPFGEEVTPWLLRRLRLATDLAAQLIDAANEATKISSMQDGK